MIKVRKVVGAIFFVWGIIMFGFFAITLEDGNIQSISFLKFSIGYFLIPSLVILFGALLLFWPTNKNKT